MSEVAPNQVVKISFNARLTGNAPAGVGVINGATVSGQNVTAISSTTAVVVVDPFGIVFSGSRRRCRSNPQCARRDSSGSDQLESFADSGGRRLRAELG